MVMFFCANFILEALPNLFLYIIVCVIGNCVLLKLNIVDKYTISYM